MRHVIQLRCTVRSLGISKIHFWIILIFGPIFLMLFILLDNFSALSKSSSPVLAEGSFLLSFPLDFPLPLFLSDVEGPLDDWAF